ncbi:MAG: ATP-binding protein [Clostridia bacterium]|nr:ATP-binding protein [Clostridia bacterium]
MLYFRDKEKEQLAFFLSQPRYKAMAIYGRRRTGKTALILDYIENQSDPKALYFQCTSYDYASCLSDFVSALSSFEPALERAVRPYETFRDVFSYLSSSSTPHPTIFVIDEFPFLAKKDENVAVEFQWIIDHALKGMKLILLGSNLSFMRKQIQDKESPLYGRFDTLLELLPFSFSEIHQLFPVFEEAMEVYAQTGGIAQYVMFFRDYPSVRAASEALLFDRNGRLFTEAPNLLMQEVRDLTTYVTILRAIAGSEKDSGKIAHQAKLDQRNIYPYLTKLIDLGIITLVSNPLSKKEERRYRICDAFFRFHYTFIEPNISLISSYGKKSREIILNDQFQEFLGFCYEDIIRENSFRYAIENNLPFVPRSVGKWWGPFMSDGEWKETEIDVIAYDNHHLILGECKYRSKATGLQELDRLKFKGQFVSSKGREIFYLLASKAGFTKEILSQNDPHLILINQI